MHVLGGLPRKRMSIFVTFFYMGFSENEKVDVGDWAATLHAHPCGQLTCFSGTIWLLELRYENGSPSLLVWIYDQSR